MRLGQKLERLAEENRLARCQRVRQGILGSGEFHGAREAVVGVRFRHAAAILEEDVLRDPEGERLGRVQQLAAREPLAERAAASPARGLGHRLPCARLAKGRSAAASPGSRPISASNGSNTREGLISAPAGRKRHGSSEEF